MRISGTLAAARGLVEAGQYLVAWRAFDEATVRTYAQTIGDFNPIHLDRDYVKQHTKYPGPVVHGMLCASMFSAMFAQRLPGSVYREQNLSFYQPVCVGEQVCARIEVVQVKQTSKLSIVSCNTTVRLVDSDALAVSGDAKVILLDSAAPVP